MQQNAHIQCVSKNLYTQENARVPAAFGVLDPQLVSSFAGFALWVFYFLSYKSTILISVDMSRICFNRHKQRLEIEAGYERYQKMHYDLLSFVSHIFEANLGNVDKGLEIASIVSDEPVLKPIDSYLGETTRRSTFLSKSYCEVSDIGLKSGL